MKSLHLILGDQLSESISSLAGYEPNQGIVLICEVLEETTYVEHHKKKIAFLFSAMRHFANSLIEKGYRVEYTKLNDPNNTGSIRTEVQRILEKFRLSKVIVTHPGEFRLLQEIKRWKNDFGIHIEIRTDQRFLCRPDEFLEWSKGKKTLRMENFYRYMRKKYSILMSGNNPIGGQWNYDVQNRKSPKSELKIPEPYSAKVDEVTHEVLKLIDKEFSSHFGDLEPFYFAVTREQALESFSMFVSSRLHNFGDYQDAMIEGEPWMYHSHIGFYLNCGLLLPLECVKAVEEAYAAGIVPLNTAEGFIRQIIGWREYMRGIYWMKMPEYKRLNFFGVSHKLPDFYWTGKTKMNCLKQCILDTKKNAYAHHIQRLMVLGNFALLFGVDPKYVNDWFLSVYADAYEWVELPNVSGMVLFADGGFLASKPYAASGSYINKMSDYCKNCSYKVHKKAGPEACPFNYLYWNFLDRNREKLESNFRVNMMYMNYDRMSKDKKNNIYEDSIRFIGELGDGKVV